MKLLILLCQRLIIEELNCTVYFKFGHGENTKETESKHEIYLHFDDDRMFFTLPVDYPIGQSIEYNLEDLTYGEGYTPYGYFLGEMDLTLFRDDIINTLKTYGKKKKINVNKFVKQLTLNKTPYEYLLDKLENEKMPIITIRMEPYEFDEEYLAFVLEVEMYNKIIYKIVHGITPEYHDEINTILTTEKDFYDVFGEDNHGYYDIMSVYTDFSIFDFSEDEINSMLYYGGKPKVISKRLDPSKLNSPKLSTKKKSSSKKLSLKRSPSRSLEPFFPINIDDKPIDDLKRFLMIEERLFPSKK